MKKLFLCVLLCLYCNQVFSTPFSGETKYENTICFTYFLMSDNSPLNGGKCIAKSIEEMNKEGWRIVQIITGTDKIGVLFERAIK